MTNSLQPLDPVRIPLNQINLIEASAGTGKTYTIGSLYLRLLLQAGENNFVAPLSVDQILVVTFTEMATEELKKKIRERISEAKQILSQYQQTQDMACFDENKDRFLLDLLPSIKDNLTAAIQRLKLAEQNMDLAAIYTIHSFCRRMLMQYAFNSGIHFNLELVTNQNALFLRLCEEFWREQFYPLPIELARLIQQELISPTAVLSEIQSFIGKTLPVEKRYQPLLAQPLSVFFQQYLAALQQQIAQAKSEQEKIKQDWLAQEQEIIEQVKVKIQQKGLNGRSYKAVSVDDWQNQIHYWAIDPDNIDYPDCLLKFSQNQLDKSLNKGAEPIERPIFKQIDDLKPVQNETELFKKVVLYHYLNGINQRLREYKRNHQEKSFDDLLQLLHTALYPQDTSSGSGEELAQLIQNQYPFAMIDEFQDTDKIQYDIFSKIYIEQPRQSGFVMIGDPKQAIYKFRGADIFTYFNAVEKAQGKFNLGKNYRSQQLVVEWVNQLFNIGSTAFLYENIQFNPVTAKDDHLRFYLNGKPEPALRCYIVDTDKPQQMAKICAFNIYQWLKSAEQNQAIFSYAETEKALKAENIAVLVRNYTEANLVKDALQQFGIASVYLSDKSDVFKSKEAKELALILRACTEPTARHILNAIATGIFALTAAQIHQIHGDTPQAGTRDFNQWLDVFSHCQQIWVQQGVLPMLHHLFLSEKITERLLGRSGGERSVTDLLHLAELLQEAAMLHRNQSALLHWFEKQLKGAGESQAQIRLESERQLVKIVTIHKSKGLEYDLVWLPFLAKPTNESKTEALSLYYAEEYQDNYWDIDNQHQDLLTKETFAEELRLLYVALTRAKYAMAISLPKGFAKKWNSLLYLLTKGELGMNGNSILSPEQLSSEALFHSFNESLSEQHFVVQKADFSANAVEPLNLFSQPTASLSAEKFNGRIEKNWQITSFTALESAHHYHKFYASRYAQTTIQAEIQSADKNGDIIDESRDYDMPTALSADMNMPEKQALTFPQGIRVGTLLHRHFEKNHFAALSSTPLIEKLCQSLGLEQDWVLPTQQWFDKIMHTPLLPQSVVEQRGLNDNVTLSQLHSQDCLKELQFYLNIHGHFSVTQFNTALERHHHLPSEPLCFEDIQGMVRGVIDLIFRHQGKYYVLDYKSNYLGDELANYQPPYLIQAMLAQHYDWQYLLYCLALHRYLSVRDKNYQYERDFGGVIYAFLRGMDGETGQGIFFDKPDWALIQQLEALF